MYLFKDYCLLYNQSSTTIYHLKLFLVTVNSSLKTMSNSMQFSHQPYAVEY